MNEPNRIAQFSIGAGLPDQAYTQTYATAYKSPQSNYRNVVFRGKLLFRFDPVRGLIELQERGEKILVDLSVVAAGG